MADETVNASALEVAPLTGAALIASRVKSLPTGPGVYRMIGAAGKPLYVGKAKNLRNRVTSYTRGRGLPERIRLMIVQTTELEIVSTHTEVEALLLESNLIKQLKPRYNILLRDDKSYPYILLRTDSSWVQMIKHRGATYENYNVTDAQASIDVILISSTGKTFGYRFRLTRQNGNKYEGSWMTDAVTPIQVTVL